MKQPETFYRQTTPWSCGPSCLMMARSALGDSIIFGEAAERCIWEQTKTNNGKFRYTTHPRLATVLTEYGYQTELWHTFPEGFVYRPGMNYWDFHRRMKYYNRFRQEAEAKGMVTRIQHFSVRELVEEVQKPNSVVIVLSKFNDSSMIFHHRLVYAANKKEIFIACPIEGKVILTHQEFDELISLPYGKGALIIRKLTD